ncbi:NlpC/P60 family protein [Vibrio breoganii]|uniref:C40 family peptidase n=2 Tax=Vibrio TaxID=662 RepID=UPI000C821710|nr:NlpC/P60 family protein [Vibrio breoganii]PMK17579.1 hydrolase [Vibrio breoganii]PML13605.1 hydrolase [Vibrio breoganii]PML40137.1 hydrolase [Vibrio breoganii]
MKHLNRSKILLITLSSLLTACASGPETNTQARVNTNQIDQQIDDKVSAQKSDELFRFYNVWHQTPYRLGGTTQNGIDCSAFTQIAYSQLFKHPLPRTTKLQSQMGVEVDYGDRRFGDLVFFKTGFNTRHVGIYVEDNSFMHASTSRGVIISRLDSPYWADVFWQIRRVN